MYRILSLSIITLLFSACIEITGRSSSGTFGDPSFEDQYEAIIVSRTDFEKEIGEIEAQPLDRPGKIYVFGKFLFINEKNKGFHVYDNRYPNAPQKVKFIKALGATDIAIRGQNYYINQATDLITFYYNENQNTFELTKRIRNIFPQKVSPNGFSMSVEEEQIIVNWIDKTQE